MDPSLLLCITTSNNRHDFQQVDLTISPNMPLRLTFPKLRTAWIAIFVTQPIIQTHQLNCHSKSCSALHQEDKTYLVSAA